MAGKENSLPINAARPTTSIGRVFSQTLAKLPDNPQNLSKGEADFLKKRQLFDGVSIEYYEEAVPPNELPKITVVKSFVLLNDEIGRRGC